MNIQAAKASSFSFLSNPYEKVTKVLLSPATQHLSFFSPTVLKSKGEILLGRQLQLITDFRRVKVV